MKGRRQQLGILLGVSITLVAAAGAPAQSPPAGLHRVDDHWTAWDPPSTFPEGAEVYVIQSGDTLWDLAGQFLGDPHLWPQIWEQNQYILDAHWIYPGDPLVMPGTGSELFADGGEFAAPPLDEGDDGLGEEIVQQATPEAPVPLGHEADIYCTGFVGELEEEFPYAVYGSEYQFLRPAPNQAEEIRGVLSAENSTQKIGLATGDILYVAGGRADGLGPGELLTAVEPERKILHPMTGEVFGRYYRYLGRIRILSSQEDHSIGEIVMSCDPIPIGTKLQRFEPEPVPLRRITPMRPVNLPVPNEELAGKPVIVASRDGIVALGAGHLVFVDQGIADGAAPGDIFTIYRESREGYPSVIVGELGILSVFEKTSLAKILRNRYTLYVGDVLVPKN